MKVRKKITQYFFFAAGALLLLLGLAVGGIYLYQDKIIQLFVTEANKHIKTKVTVEKIEVTLWEKFPQVAINLRNVEVTEAVPGSTAPLAKLTSIYSTFNIWDFWKGSYRIRELHLEGGEVLAKVLPTGEVNYLFYQDADTTHSGKLSFDLENILLKKVRLTYQDALGKQTYDLQVHNMQATLSVEDPVITIQTKGDMLIHSVLVGKSEFLKQKEITLRNQLVLHTRLRQVTVQPSELHVGNAVYQVNGDILYKTNTQLDLVVQGKNTNIQALLALLPPSYSKHLAQYRSKGDIYFRGILKGEVSAKKSPFIDLFFGAKEASFYHPEYKEKIEHVHLEGRFTNGTKRTAQTSVLELRKVKGNLRSKPFSGEFVYRNFSNPDVQAQLTADVDLAHVLDVFPVADIQKGSGQVQVQFSFAGNLRAFKANPSGAGITTSGEVGLQQVGLLFRQHPIPFKGLTGTFLFRKNDVAVTGFKGKIGDSDFLLNGYFKNVLAWMFLDGQRLRVEADFVSTFMNLDQLLAASPAEKVATNKKERKATGTYAFHMPATLEFDLNASVSRLHFRRFKAKQLHGQVLLQNQVLTSPTIAMQAVGGNFKVRGILDARRPLIQINSTTTLEAIKVDSLMFVFENFSQEFITQRHLRGELTAQIESELFFDHALSPRTDLMQAEVKTSIRNGQLLSFEPLQKLGTFIDRRELANLRFSELQNNFWIQDRTIYFPEMEIKSSTSRFSNITISGTHTFSQDMDYHLRIPLVNQHRRRDKDERYGVVAAGSTPAPNLFLTMKGKEGNFKIVYDQEKVKDKMASDLQREKQELKDALKGKKKEETAVKPAEEYFDL